MTAERLDPPPIARPRPAVELTEGECWHLLESASIGRVVFTQRAMPAIRPVNHLIDGRKIIIRTHQGAAIASRAVGESADGLGKLPGSVVCYEADELDPVRHQWHARPGDQVAGGVPPVGGPGVGSGDGDRMPPPPLVAVPAWRHHDQAVV